MKLRVKKNLDCPRGHVYLQVVDGVLEVETANPAQVEGLDWLHLRKHSDWSKQLKDWHR